MAKIQTVAARVLDKLRSASQPNAPQETRNGVVEAVDELRRELRQLEADAEELERARAAHAEQAATCEAQAMEAIRCCDDDAARQAIVSQTSHVEHIKVVDAELMVVDALIAECREVLNQSHTANSPRAS